MPPCTINRNIQLIKQVVRKEASGADFHTTAALKTIIGQQGRLWRHQQDTRVRHR